MSCHTVELTMAGLRLGGMEVALLFLILVARFGFFVVGFWFEFSLQVWAKMIVRRRRTQRSCELDYVNNG